MRHTGASRRSPNDTLWETLIQRLSANVCIALTLAKIPTKATIQLLREEITQW